MDDEVRGGGQSQTAVGGVLHSLGMREVKDMKPLRQARLGRLENFLNEARVSCIIDNDPFKGRGGVLPQDRLPCACQKARPITGSGENTDER
ncbi:MAG: hypothetical protein RL648_794 [Verrucomicrobiota bacterium]|jgi:hypothetical protein